VVEDVAFLMADAALDGDVAEDGVNGGSESLAAVQDHQDALVAVQGGRPICCVSAVVDDISECDGSLV